MLATAVAMIQRFLAPGGSGGDAASRPSSPVTAPGGDDEQGQEDERSQAAAMLTRQTEEWQGLKRQAKLAAVLIGVLLVLNIESTPIVVADFHLRDQYGDQVRSLVQVEGLVTRLDEVVSGGARTWEQRVSDQIDTAMRRISDLDAYDQLLAADDGPAPVRPEFLQACSGRDPEVANWIQTSDALRSQWSLVVARCIIEPMGADFDGDGRDRLTAPLAAAQTDVTTAIVLAQREFPQAMVPVTAPPSEPSLTPTAEPVERIARQALTEIERSVNQAVWIVKAGPEAAISPPPAEWLTQFTGGDGSLRSFRDNMLLTYAAPYGGTTMTNRSDSVARLSITPLAVSVEGAHGLNTALTGVRDSQKALQESIDERVAELEPAIPDLFKPVLIFVKPTYLVLLFPLVVALVGGYLLMTYTRLQWNARRLRALGVTDLPPPFFIALVLVPLSVLLGLFPAYDWPQFVHSWWQWTHRGPLVLFVVIALGCAFVVRAAGTGDGGNRPASEPGAEPVSGQHEPAPEPRPKETPNPGLPQPNVGPLDA
jgi:hypothetical protein